MSLLLETAQQDAYRPRPSALEAERGGRQGPIPLPARTDLLGPAGPFPSPAASPEGTPRTAPPPALVTALLPLDVRFPCKLQLGATGAPDADRLRPALQVLLSPALAAQEGLGPTEAGRGQPRSQRRQVHVPPLRDLTAATELPPGSTEPQRLPEALTQPPTSTLQPCAHEAPPRGPPDPRAPPLRNRADARLC